MKIVNHSLTSYLCERSESFNDWSVTSTAAKITWNYKTESVCTRKQATLKWNIRQCSHLMLGHHTMVHSFRNQSLQFSSHAYHDARSCAGLHNRCFCGVRVQSAKCKQRARRAKHAREKEKKDESLFSSLRASRSVLAHFERLLSRLILCRALNRAQATVCIRFLLMEEGQGLGAIFR